MFLPNNYQFTEIDRFYFAEFSENDAVKMNGCGLANTMFNCR